MSLYNKIIDLQKLSTAWKKVRKNKPAAGVDNITCEQFDMNSREELKQLSEELRNHEYETLPVRTVMLYKGEKARRIALYSMRDKVVQQSLASELNKIYEPVFSDSTYSYRNGKSALDAVDLISEKMQSGIYHYVLKLDISTFFDNIQWGILQKLLMKKIMEKDVIELIQHDVQVKSLEDTGELLEKRIGIHQGSGISPVLSNIYLLDFDRWMSSRDVFYIRYSDDMLILGKARDQLIHLLAEIKNRLFEYGLHVNDKKQVLADIMSGVDFLGYHISGSGKTIPVKAEQSLMERLEIMWLTSADMDIEDKIKKASEIIGGWEQYFREERDQISIFEFITLAGLAGDNIDKLKLLADKRERIDNIYKDIMLYLSEYWRIHEKPDLELLEYEQFFRIWEKRNLALSVPERDNILKLYRRYLINPNSDIIIEIMQCYTDLQEYNKASFWMDRKEEVAKEKLLLHKDIVHISEKGASSDISWDKGTLSRFLKNLAGREDIYALETIDNGNRRKNEFQSLPLTEKIIEKHLSGECTVATYIQRSNSTVKYMIIDVDISKKIIMQHGNDGEIFKEYLSKTGKVAQQIVILLHSFGMQGYIEFSGYRGYHVWVFFTEWIPARYVNMLADIIEGQMNLDADQGISIEFFPNKTRLKPGKFGQAIKLPYGMHGKTGDISYFIDDNSEKVTEISSFLDSIGKSSLNTLKKVLAANKAYHEDKTIKTVDENLDAFGDATESIMKILKNR